MGFFMLKKGFIQIYTGDGKGKTTASLGVALRILGAGGKVFYAQFIKGRILSSEFEILNKFDEFSYHAFGKGRFIKGKPVIEDIEIAQKGLKECGIALASGEYDLIVMDELNGAIKCGLLQLDEVIAAVKMRHPQTELIITGRNAPHELIKLADLVTEMNSVKHYIDQGVSARQGIEK